MTNLILLLDIRRCEPLPYYQNAIISGNFHSVDSIVNVYCIDGYRFSDGQLMSHIKCTDTLQWNPVLTECTGIKCVSIFIQHIIGRVIINIPCQYL